MILQDLLLASFVRGLISRTYGPQQLLSRTFGTQIDGPNVEVIKGNVAVYDIYDKTGRVMNARAQAAPASRIALNPVGKNTVVLGTFKESIALDYNNLINIRKLGEGADMQDQMGANYIAAQVRTLRERADNTREFLTGALFNGGKYGYFIDGDNWVPTYSTSADITVDLKFDSGNILTGASFAAGLQMGTGSNIITASWATAGTDIPLQLDAIDSAFQDQVRAPLRKVFCSPSVWANVIQNDKVRQVAGTANISADFFRDDDVGPDGQQTGLIKCRLKARPWIEWYVLNTSLSLATSNATTFGNVKLLPTDYCTFFPDMASMDHFKLVEGSEYIKDNDLADAVERFGFYAWGMEKADPAKVWYHTHMNAGLRWQIPKAVAWARVQ